MSSGSPPPRLPPPSSLIPTITPAYLSSLVIYNPSLGSTDETLQDQIVFYTSRKRNTTLDDQLRAIGLAQGVVGFARGFSNSDHGTAVETQKSRIVSVEIEEPGWWILAHIDLTYIYNPTTQPPTTEYSSREVSPTSLLLPQLHHAYHQFRFSYGTFADNFGTLGRTAFTRRLEKYWLRWAWRRWEVMMNGSPAVELLCETPGAVKMAGGKPGREIGGQEKEFLEGWVKKEKGKGLVEMAVSRFGQGTAGAEERASGASKGSGMWFWSNSGTVKEGKLSGERKEPGQEVRITPEDGCVFLGTGELESDSLRDLTKYLGELYLYGEERETARRKRRRRAQRTNSNTGSSREASPTPAKGKKVVMRSRAATTTDGEEMRSSPLRTRAEAAPAEGEGHEQADPDALQSLEPRPMDHPESPKQTVSTSSQQRNSSLNTNLLSYLTFGWHSRSSTPPPLDGNSDAPTTPESESSSNSKKATFLIGFEGDLDVEDMEDDDDGASGGRITSRTVFARRRRPSSSSSSTSDSPSPGEESGKRASVQTILPLETAGALEEFRIVVYLNAPFIFAFLYTPTTPYLHNPSFYRSLHNQLAPLLPRLLPSTASTSLQSLTSSPGKPPYNLLLHQTQIYSTLPPIPGLGETETPGWSRIDALHVYTVVLGMLEDGKTGGGGERSVRTARGWCVQWIRMNEGVAVVVRRAGERKKEEVGLAGGEMRGYFEGLVRGFAAGGR